MKEILEILNEHIRKQKENNKRLFNDTVKFSEEIREWKEKYHVKRDALIDLKENYINTPKDGQKN